MLYVRGFSYIYDFLGTELPYNCLFWKFLVGQAYIYIYILKKNASLEKEKKKKKRI
jgi:hypothetical protein